MNGGAIAIGHPLGMSGARLVVTLLHELRRRGGRYGVATMCVGVGQGQAALFERAMSRRRALSRARAPARPPRRRARRRVLRAAERSPSAVERRGAARRRPRSRTTRPSSSPSCDADGLEPQRARWLGDQLRGRRTYAWRLAGEPIAYVDEVERCYGVRPSACPRTAFAAAHRAARRGAPAGAGSLAERYEAWRTAHTRPAEPMLETSCARSCDAPARPHEALGRCPADEERRARARRRTSRGPPSTTTSAACAAGSSSTPTSRSRRAELVAPRRARGLPGPPHRARVEGALLLDGRGLPRGVARSSSRRRSRCVSEGIAEIGGGILLDDATSDGARRGASWRRRDRLRPGARGRGRGGATSRSAPSGTNAALAPARGRRLRPRTCATTSSAGRSARAEARAVGDRVPAPTRPGARTSSTLHRGRRLARAYVGGDLERFRRLLTERARARPTRVARYRPP